MCIAVIGGSGLYQFLDGKTEIQNTPFGQSAPITTFQFGGKKAYFLTRHGEGHAIPPHLINYKANIYALRELNINHVIATNAVGSLHMDITPGDFIIPDQLIDLTNSRESTFFMGDSKPDYPVEFRKVKHTDVSYPYEGDVQQTLLNVLSKYNEIDCHTEGTYVCTNGPRFETAAEIQMAKQAGGDIVGMTSAPECFLARELDLDYASICLVTNYGAGMQMRITQEEVVRIFNQRIETVKEIIMECINSLITKDY
ncbi:MAG: S-methyl-5'-thioinosine phosphorylase [Candidatus Thorarchaeota archaeon]|jgi:5'-methylthioadenosine phosphorylase